MIHACGKLGCVIVGCCHGRPCRFGIRYGREHADVGFPSHLVNIALFPIQLMESVFVLCLVVLGTIVLLKGHPPGSALAFYALFYAAGRFCMELPLLAAMPTELSVEFL